MARLNLEAWLGEKFNMTLAGARILIRRGLKYVDTKDGAYVMTIVTHDGVTFHADEIFGIALLEYYAREILGITHPTNIVRGRGLSTNENILHIDVDRTFLDHHFATEDKAYHDDLEIPYCSCGMIWRIIGADIVGEKYVDNVAKTLFDAIDAADNGVDGAVSQLSMIISNYNGEWDDEEYNQDAAILEALELATDILRRVINKTKSKARACELVEEALSNSDGTIVKLPKFAPWQETLIPSTAKYVYWQNPKEEWCCQAVPVEPLSFKTKCPFKESWRGLPADQLKTDSQLALKFVHATGFYMVAETEEAVLEACRKSLEEES